MKLKFNYKKKNINLDVKVCESILSQASGLMFRKRSPALLFVFKSKKRRIIHSFFCVPFVAIWFDNNNIVDAKIIKKWRLNIKPKGKFDRLLEIPINNKAFFLFTDEEKV